MGATTQSGACLRPAGLALARERPRQRVACLALAPPTAAGPWPARRQLLTCRGCGAIFSSCTWIWVGSGSASASASARARPRPPCHGLEASSAPPCRGPVGVPSDEQVVARRVRSAAISSAAAGVTAPSPSLSSAAAAILRGRRRREPGVMGASSGSASSCAMAMQRRGRRRGVVARGNLRTKAASILCVGQNTATRGAHTQKV